ncbi:MAG: glycerophosphodiester phosphodiesterase [Candidatus Saccharibacteria bacterium]|nr:glycerophosphodiester phosphodiesterase [Candidatus Saccharibacteria bacterium]
MKMKIIGHRGAAGLALENTLESLRAGINAGAHSIEFDVRLTKDGEVVLCHDSDLKKISQDKRSLKDLTLEELKTIKLNNGESVPLLSEALETTGRTPVIIEIKEDNMVRKVINIVEAYPEAIVTIASFKHYEISLLKRLSPNTKAYVGSRTNPFELLQNAKAIGADGLDLNFWDKLDIMVYTIDSQFLARFIHFLYPKVMICTNNPQYFTKNKPRKSK